MNNTSTPSSGNGSGTESGLNPGWVSKTDRHRQLINTNVYEKETRNRAKAIEQTRSAKLNNKRIQEKARVKEFFGRQTQASAASANAKSTSESNEIVVEGIRFIVTDGGKKLSRIKGKEIPHFQVRNFLTCPETTNSAFATPKTVTIAGVKFYRTKTGNLVVNRVVKDHRYVSTAPAYNLLTKMQPLRRSEEDRRAVQDLLNYW